MRFYASKKIAMLAPQPLGEISGGAHIKNDLFWVFNDSENHPQTPPTLYEIDISQSIVSTRSWVI